MQLAREPLCLQEVPRSRADVKQSELERGLRVALVIEVLEPAGELRGRERCPALDEGDHQLLRAQERVQRVGRAPEGEESVSERDPRGEAALRLHAPAAFPRRFEGCLGDVSHETLDSEQLLEERDGVIHARRRADAAREALHKRDRRLEDGVLKSDRSSAKPSLASTCPQTQ